MLLLLACASAPQPDADGLAKLDARYLELAADLGVADRDTSRNTSNKEARARKVAAEQARVAFFKDADNIAAIEGARTDPDPLVAAKAEAYWREATFLRSWTDTEKEREQDLLASLEEARRQPWTWTNEAGDVEIDLAGRWDGVSIDADELSPEVRADITTQWAEGRTEWLGEELTQLVELRNEVARREGFDSYWELSLAHSGLEVADAEALFAEIEALVTPINKAAQARAAEKAGELGIDHSFANDPMLRRQLGLRLDTTEVDSWFDGDLAEERISQSFSDLGLPIDGLQIYHGPSRYTRSGAFSFPIRPPERAAVVYSVDSRWGPWTYQALAHEVGLATWWRALPAGAASSPVTWNPSSAWFEGYGDLFERMLFEPAWLEKYVPEMPPEARETLATSRRQSSVDTLTWYLGCAQMERAIYENPQGLLAVAEKGAALEKQLRGWSFDAPRNEAGIPTTSFLQSGLMWHYPGYVQNFLSAAVAEAVIWQAMTDAVGDPVANPKVGPWLTDNVVVPVASGEPFAKRLDALAGGSRSAPLESWLTE
jgi:hypothetical protein